MQVREWRKGYRTFLQVHDELGLRQPGSPMIIADYSSLEVGVQGDLALRLFGDRQIITMYEDQDKNGKNVDIHSNNARNVFGKWLGWKIPPHVVVEGKPILCKWAGETVDVIPVEEFKKHPYGKICRDLIKAVWYGLAYGKGAYGFSTLIGTDGQMIGEARAQEMIDALLDSVPAMRRWFEWVIEYVNEYHGIYSLDGRWCDLSIEMSTDDEWMHKRAYRRANNFPMQAAGAGIIGDAMVRVRSCKELASLGPHEFERAKVLLVGHMKSATANGTPLLVPLQVSVGHGVDYYEAK